MKLIFVHGPPAVGKLTIARELSTMSGLPLFHNHLVVDIVGLLYEFGTPPFIELREELWLDVFEKAATSGTSLIFTFNPEATVSDGFVDDVRRVVERDHGGEVVFVALDCPEQELEQRMDSPSREEHGKLRSRKLYRELRDQGAFAYRALPPPQVRIDTGTCTAEDAARRIFETLKL